MLGSEGTLPRNWEKSYCIFCGRSQTFRRPQDLQYGHSGFFPWPQQLAEKWVTLQRDEATNGFLKRCLAGPTFWEVCKLAPFRVLRWFVSATDANAILKRGEMFVLSSQQLLQLGCPSRGTLLDIGAGAGDVTCQLAPLFDQVLVTEVSRPMVATLQEKGFPVLSAPDLTGLEALAEKHEISLGPGASVDCIALMNVLDRCDRPLTLLKDVREHLKPGGRLLLAVVLPFRPFVESGIFKLQPSEQLHLNRSATWEAAVEEMWQKVLVPMGFKLEALARVPYLCKGDLFSSIYVLDDAIFVLSCA